MSRLGIVTGLAAEAAWPLTKNRQLQVDMWALYNTAIAHASGVTQSERKTHTSYRLTHLRDGR